MKESKKKSRESKKKTGKRSKESKKKLSEITEIEDVPKVFYESLEVIREVAAENTAIARFTVLLTKPYKKRSGIKQVYSSVDFFPKGSTKTKAEWIAALKKKVTINNPFFAFFANSRVTIDDAIHHIVDLYNPDLINKKAKAIDDKVIEFNYRTMGNQGKDMSEKLTLLDMGSDLPLVIYSNKV